MRAMMFITGLLVIGYPISASALVGVGLGGKVGHTNYSGDVLPGSGDVGGGTSFGAILEITTLPVIDFELHANYFSTPFQYTYDVATVPVTTEFDFQDFNVIAIAKKNLISVPMSPLGLYVGGGVGLHVINTEVAQGYNYDSVNADNPVDLLASSGRLSGHGMVGVRLAPPVLPLAIFGEARFGRIFTEEPITTTEIEAGLMLKF